MKSNCLRAMAMGSALGLALFASPALSATYSVVNKIEGGTCASSSSVTGSVVETCDTTIVGPNGQREIFDLVGRSEAGNLGIEASLTLDATASTSAQQNTFGSVNAVFDDTLTFGVESGVFRLAVDIDGTQTASVNPVFGGTTAASQFIALVNGTTVYSRNLIDSAFPQDVSTGSLGTTFLDFSFSGFSLGIAASLSAFVSCNSIASGDVCSTTAAFFNSLRFVGGEVRDASGNLVDTTIVATSGFDYRSGIEPHSPPPPTPSPIPLPASAWLLLAGVAGLLGVRRRRAL